MSTSPSSSPPPPSSDVLSSTDTTAFTITLVAIVAAIVFAALVVATLIMRCIQGNRKQYIYMMEESAQPISQLETTVISGAPRMESIVISGGSRIESVVISEGSRIEFVSIERFLEDFQREKPMRFTAQNLMYFTCNYAEKLGSGGFGIVYKGYFPNEMCIAVKVLHSITDKSAEEQFMAEVGTIGRTYHVNLVKLYGFCFDAKVKALVYEFMENGSMERYLFGEKESIEWGKLYEVAVGTGKGIRYLHEECDKKIVHYDIKPGNILLSSSFEPKVADFGLARLCDREKTHFMITGARGTPGYAAPELWLPFPVTEKCDVYSYGMMLFEILGRRRNFAVGTDSSSSMDWFPRWVWKTFEQTTTMEAVISGCGIEATEREKAERLCKVAMWCVQRQPEARPSMSSVVRMLEGEMEIAEPGNPFQYLSPIPSVAASNVFEDSLGGTTSSSLHRIHSIEIVELGV